MQAYEIMVEVQENVYEAVKIVVASSEEEALIEAGFMANLGLWFPNVRAIPVCLEVNGVSIVL